MFWHQLKGDCAGLSVPQFGLGCQIWVLGRNGGCMDAAFQRALMPRSAAQIQRLAPFCMAS